MAENETTQVKIRTGRICLRISFTSFLEHGHCNGGGIFCLGLVEAWLKKDQFAVLATHQRLSAIRDHTASTMPMGHAPWRNPYTDTSAHATANATMSQGLRFSSA